AAQGAAEAAVLHRDDLALAAGIGGEQPPVDLDGAQLVHDHADLEAVVPPQDTIEQSRLAGAQEAGQNPDRYRTAPAWASHRLHSAAGLSNVRFRLGGGPRSGQLDA